MTNWLSGNVTANGVNLHYHRAGGDGPPVVLLHGITDNGLCWTRVAQVLQADFDVIMVDARGHGLSEAPDRGYLPDDRAADLAGLIQALGLERPCLMGHSMGADTAAVTAALYPELASCVVLEDPPWREALSFEEARNAIAEGFRTRVSAHKSRSLKDVIAAGREEHPEWDEIEFGPWAQAKLQFSLHALQAIVGLSPHWQDIAARIACPTLLITSDPDRGGRITPEVAAILVAGNPHFEVVHIGAAGHNIRRERFEPYVAAVTSFLSSKSLVQPQ